METWSAHQLFQKTSEIFGRETAQDITNYANYLRKSNLPVIFSLKHLSYITGIDYEFLHNTVNRDFEASNYSVFSIQKRSGGRRFIHAVNGKLFVLQKYINSEILQKVQPQSSSYAFNSSGGIRKCASIHCGCKWLFQFDLKDFFYSISEPMIFKVFHDMGYNRLLSFELARLCTTTHLPKAMRSYLKANNQYILDESIVKKPYFKYSLIGVLPQGAPTSPMLSNLAAKRLDDALNSYSVTNGFQYTRYADDLTFSASELPVGKSISQIKSEIVTQIRRSGFKENNRKMHIAGPGSKKMVLGLLVDGEKPRISRQLKKRIDRNLYSIIKFGLEQSAIHDCFESTYGYINHVLGLISYIKDVDYDYWKRLEPNFKTIERLIDEFLAT